MTITPRLLTPGSTIALFSPSSPGPMIFPRRYRRGIDALRAMGYSIVEGASCRGRDGYRSASPQERAREFETFIADDSIAAILATIGGLNTIEMLPYLDYDLIARYPKAVCGYSDTSVLLNAIYARSDVVTFHGPALIPSFGEFPAPLPDTVGAFSDVVSDRTPKSLRQPGEWTDEFLDWTTDAWESRPRKMFRNEGPVWHAARPTAVEGTLVGGNLDSLLGIIGTEYWAQPSDSILLVENMALPVDRWAMEIWALKVRRVLARCRAILLGKHEGVPRDLWAPITRILLETAREENPEVLLVADLDVGHTSPILTLPIGGRMRLDPRTCSITLLSW